MKILRLYYKVPPLKGGMEKHIYFLSRIQSKQNDVTVFYNQGDRITDNDIQILPNFKVDKLKPQFLGVLLFHISSIVKLFKTKSKFDVIHIHGDWSSLIFISIFQFVTGAKLVVFSVHGQITRNFNHKILLKKYLKKVDLVFVTGYESFEKIKRMKSKNVFFQPSGITNHYLKNSIKQNCLIKNKTVVTTANLLKVKNIPFILEIAARCPDLNFVIIGDGPEKNKIEMGIREKSLTNVSLKGNLCASDIIKEYEDSFCFLLTSFAEGTPTAVLEAMSFGLPILTINVGGIKQIIKNDINGYVINRFQSELFSDILKNTLFNKKLLKQISETNILEGRNYSWVEVSKKITNITNESFSSQF